MKWKQRMGTGSFASSWLAVSTMVVLAIICFFAITMTAYADDIQVNVEFNSPDRMYMHRDVLGLTLEADYDSYIKVIHIDANDLMKTIFPNSQDKANFLKAGERRKLFQTTQYVLYEPYGEERIIIVTSPVQFPNIEQEYLEPWKAATVENITMATRTVTKGGDLELIGTGSSRGGDLEFSGGTETYFITIVQPNEEFEYDKPVNITSTFNTIRNDVLKKGGTFFGNETSGFYILNDVRNSYRIPRESPDKVRVAIYYPENLKMDDIMTISNYFMEK